jgi:probable phosphoglycerate mutase
VSTTEIVIVRHGETWNVTGSKFFESQRGLTGNGIAQVKALAERLVRDADVHGSFTALYTSPRISCLNTCTPIAEALGLRARVAHELRADEDGPGTGDESVRARRGPELDRVVRFLAQLLSSHPGGRLVVVGHSATQAAALTGLLRAPACAAEWDAAFEYGGLCRWTCHAGVWALAAPDDAQHLDASIDEDSLAPDARGHAEQGAAQ